MGGGRPATPRPTVLLGDRGALVSTGSPEAAQRLAAAVRQAAWPGVEDVVPAADSVGILVDPALADAGDVARRAAVLTAPDGSGTTAPDAPHPAARDHEVEVCFDGPDLDEVAALLATTQGELVRLLTGAEWRVGWLGFMPGFAYLTGLPAPLRALPRRARPRERVAAGSFAVAGGMAAIYPFATPGGWNVLGRSSTRLFDPDLPPHAVLSPGDAIHLRAVGEASEPALPSRRPLVAVGPRIVEVLDAGFLTTVQDLGRIGVAHLGVPRAGPADPLRHRIANAACGNPPEAPVLEVTGAGPVLRFAAATYVALVGDCPIWLDERELPPGSVVPVTEGNVLSVGRVRTGARAYLGVAGGISGPRHFGSASADTATPLPPGPLRRGDRLSVGERIGRPRGIVRIPPVAGTIELEVTPGPDLSGGRELERLLAMTFRVASSSNRTGVRLTPDEPAAAALATESHEVPSRATAVGLVQLPPGGEPVVLGPDHGTVGGYPAVAVVTTASLADIGQVRPGDTVRLRLAAPGPDATAETDPTARRTAAHDPARSAERWFPADS